MLDIAGPVCTCSRWHTQCVHVHIDRYICTYLHIIYIFVVIYVYSCITMMWHHRTIESNTQVIRVGEKRPTEGERDIGVTPTRALPS